MFLLKRPTRREIERFIDRSHGLPLSYGPTGIVRHRPAVKRFDEQVVTVGRGQADFERARGALERWNHFNIGWVEAQSRVKDGLGPAYEITPPRAQSVIGEALPNAASPRKTV